MKYFCLFVSIVSILNWIICISFIAVAYDYEIVGPVENVIYVTSEKHPCYVAMSTGDGRQFYYHAAYNVEQCKFAERARNLNLEVKIYGEVGDSSSNNGLLGIEYAGTNSKFWFANKAI